MFEYMLDSERTNLCLSTFGTEKIEKMFEEAREKAEVATNAYQKYLEGTSGSEHSSNQK